ncbi:MAG: 1-acyl-sn-glycerol-3-phosphate acyltransferase [Clostridia bacterium]|nr:1-acyl-sn-glycerol-3-phosphate acyltransferase [Clostridia bacterium]
MSEEKKDKKKKEYSILQPVNKKGRHVNIPALIARLAIAFVWLMYPFRFYGHRKVKDGAFLYVYNHYRIWDVAYAACTTSEGLHYVAKSELKKSFIWPICKAVKMIVVDRDGSDARGLMDMLRCLKNGEKVVIAPEGTRNKTDAEMLPFHNGVALLAIKTKTPVVPIVIYKKPKLFRMAHILVGEPFELSEYYGQKPTDEVLTEATEKIRQRMLDMKREHTQFLEEKKNKKKQKALKE